MLCLQLLACTPTPQKSDDNACQAMVAAYTQLQQQLDSLEAQAASLSMAFIENSEEDQAHLLAFNQNFKSILDAIESLHAEYEVACKWPLLMDNDFAAVAQQIYLPYLQALARQADATRALARHLEQSAPTELVGDTVAAYLMLASEIEQGMLAQVAICEADFDPEQCQAFRASAHALLASSSTGTP